MGLLLNLTSPPKSRAPTRPMQTMQMPSSSAKSLGQQKIIGTRSFKQKGGPTRSPNQSSILDGQRQAVGLGKHRLVPSTVQPTRKIYLDMSFYKELTSKYKASGTLPWPTSSPTKSATTYKMSWASLANTIVCSKDFLKRNEMPSASASSCKPTIQQVSGPVPFKTEPSRYR